MATFGSLGWNAGSAGNAATASGFISPGVQREQIEAWARRNDASVARVFEELDESGGRSDRPLLMEAIARLERGDSQGIVVAYLSRFGRSLADGLNAIKRITDAGGAFIQAALDHLLKGRDTWPGKRDFYDASLLLLEAIGRVERGESEAIVGAYLSRFGRSLRMR
jgi:resolvase-like protein